MQDPEASGDMYVGVVDAGAFDDGKAAGSQKGVWYPPEEAQRPRFGTFALGGLSLLDPPSPSSLPHVPF